VTHNTRITTHDHVNCHTSRVWTPSNGDCGTRYETHCSCGFGQGAGCHEQAAVIARGHRADPDAEVISWDNTPLTADTIADQQLRDLFSRHCECRPLDLTRTSDDHAAIHDCDTGILHDVQTALNIIRFDDIGRIQAIHQARERCAQFINEQRKVR
jgi:hypothetical protein